MCVALLVPTTCISSEFNRTVDDRELDRHRRFSDGSDHHSAVRRIVHLPAAAAGR